MTIEEKIKQYEEIDNEMRDMIITYITSYGEEVNFYISQMEDLHIIKIDSDNDMLIDYDGYEWNIKELETKVLVEIYNELSKEK